MRIKKALNNNVAIVGDGDMEKIVMGRGICFSKHAGDELDESKIEKTFVSNDTKVLGMFKSLLSEIPFEYFELSQNIIGYAKSDLGKSFDDRLYLDLTDHMYAAIKRYQEGVVVKNAILLEIQRFYASEYEVGLYALEIIKERFGVDLPPDEAGFIALHFVNAALNDGNMDDIYKITKIMQEITNIIKYHFKREFDEKSVYYYRFMTHLRFFSQRLLGNATYNDTNDSDLQEIIKKRYKEAFACTQKIAIYCKNTYNYDLGEEEMMYLTIHIERLIKNA
jgi:beta-glucoside operon transcriptional antiterminator